MAEATLEQVGTITEAPSLSERQLGVLRGYAAGLTYAQMGVRLHVPEDVIKERARTLFVRLGAKNKAHAVGIAFRSGLLTSSDVRPGGGQSR